MLKSALNRLTAYVYLAPAVLIMAFACVYPLADAIKLSFYEWSLGTPWEAAKFLGLEAYTRMLQDPAVLRSLRLTVVFALIVVSLEMALGIVLALVLERPVRGMAVFRTMFISPMMIAPIVVGLSWRYLFDTQYGPINFLIGLVGIPPQAWLADPTLAFAAIVVSDVWQWTPFVIIMVLAGLQTIDHSVIEATWIDGCSLWQTILLVKLPLILPIIMVTLLMRLIDAFRVLEVIYILTFGGPGDSTEILTIHLYKSAFVSQKLGYASAIAVLLLVVVLGLSYAALSLSNPLRRRRKA